MAQLTAAGFSNGDMWPASSRISTSWLPGILFAIVVISATVDIAIVLSNDKQRRAVDAGKPGASSRCDWPSPARRLLGPGDLLRE